MTILGKSAFTQLQSFNSEIIKIESEGVVAD
jgi:hypothetical protein